MKLEIDGDGIRIRNESLAAIASISSLTKLWICESLITDVSALEPLASLTDLSLIYSAHLDSGVEALGRMSALTTIDLRSTKVAPSDLGHLLNATFLSYSNGEVTVSAQFSDFCLPRLSSLTLEDVNVSGRSYIPSLTSLELNRCTTSRDTKESLGQLTSLTSLAVRGSDDFDDDALSLMPLSITDLVVPNYLCLGIQRLTNLVSLNIVKSWTQHNPWDLWRIETFMPAGLKSLTLTAWRTEEFDEAIDAAVTLTSLTSLSIRNNSYEHVTELSADALKKLAAATHLTSVTIGWVSAT